MSCEGKISIYDKEGKHLSTIDCPGPEGCLRKKIWGEPGVKGLGLDGTASKISGIPVDKLQAAFNSKCQQNQSS